MNLTPPLLRLAAPLLIALGLVAACDTAGPGADSEAQATWSVIQDRILTPACAGCHQVGNAFAEQSGLILTADEAYGQLVNARASNAAAKDAGLMRVDPDAGSDLHRHFLWEKVNAPEHEHLLQEHPGYGAPMPLGAEPLTFGELAYIRAWLLDGAPRTGNVADEALLSDTTRYRTASFSPLPTLSASQGLSYRLGPFDVAPNFEREFFFFEPAVVAEERLVDRIEMRLRPGSHHFIVYSYDESTGAPPAAGVIRDLRRPDGTLNPLVLRQMFGHVFFAGTQWPKLDYRFPPGVALRLPAGTGFDLNGHYVNRTEQPRQGEVHFNLHFADPSATQRTADVLMLNNTDLWLPAGRTTTVSKTFTFDERIQVFQLFSHAHEHMTSFVVRLAGGARDGESVYLATDWAHPPILSLDPPLVLEAGQGFTLEATYNNWTDAPLSFGLLSEDEMMILFGYYFTD